MDSKNQDKSDEAEMDPEDQFSQVRKVENVTFGQIHVKSIYEIFSLQVISDNTGDTDETFSDADESEYNTDVEETK